MISITPASQPAALPPGSATPKPRSWVTPQDRSILARMGYVLAGNAIALALGCVAFLLSLKLAAFVCGVATVANTVVALRRLVRLARADRSARQQLLGQGVGHVMITAVIMAATWANFAQLLWTA